MTFDIIVIFVVLPLALGAGGDLGRELELLYKTIDLYLYLCIFIYHLYLYILNFILTDLLQGKHNISVKSPEVVITVKRIISFYIIT